MQNVAVKLKVGNAPFVARRQMYTIPITCMKALIVIACQSAKRAVRQTIFVPADKKGEPLFQNYNAKVEFKPVTTLEDVKKAS